MVPLQRKIQLLASHYEDRMIWQLLKESFLRKLKLDFMGWPRFHISSCFFFDYWFAIVIEYRVAPIRADFDFFLIKNVLFKNGNN